MRSIQTKLEERQRLNDVIRQFFRSREFLEVETPILVASPGMEPNLSPFETVVREPNGTEYSAGLITSPEYAMKKILASGIKKAFTLTKVFRNEEAFGGGHNPEFTMLEWYEQGADYHACMRQTEELIQEAAAAFDQELLPFRQIRVHELFLEHVGVDLDSATGDTLRTRAKELGMHHDPSDTESDLFYRLFLEFVEPRFQDSNVFVYDYPLHQAALSQLTKDGQYGQRFELYLQGLELCNGFTELTDSLEQRRRFEEEGRERHALGKTVFPIDEAFLGLLPSLQNPTCGNALGVDRLHMHLIGSHSIDDVLCFPSSELFTK